MSRHLERMRLDICRECRSVEEEETVVHFLCPCPSLGEFGQYKGCVSPVSSQRAAKRSQLSFMILELLLRPNPAYYPMHFSQLTCQSITKLIHIIITRKKTKIPIDILIEYQIQLLFSFWRPIPIELFSYLRSNTTK